MAPNGVFRFLTTLGSELPTSPLRVVQVFSTHVAHSTPIENMSMNTFALRAHRTTSYEN